MRGKKETFSEWVDPDDAPLVTKATLKDAEIFEGNKFIQRGRGRPRLANPKESINIRLDQDILTTLRQIGPGWQSKVNEILREALKL